MSLQDPIHTGLREKIPVLIGVTDSQLSGGKGGLFQCQFNQCIPVSIWHPVPTGMGGRLLVIKSLEAMLIVPFQPVVIAGLADTQTPQCLPHRKMGMLNQLYDFMLFRC